MDNTAISKGIFCQTAGRFEQLTNGRDITVHLKFAGAHHCTAQLNEVLIAIQNRVDIHRVGIAYLKLVPFEVAERVDTLLPTRFSEQGDVVLKGIARETTGIFNECTDTFGRFHFVAHGTLHLTGDINDTLIRPYNNNVVGCQTNVPAQTAIENKIIDIDRGNQLTAAIHLDRTQRTDVIDSSRRIERMKHGRESRECVSAGHFYLPHHVHRNRFGLSHGEFHLRAAETRSQGGAQFGIGLCHSHTAHLNGTKAFDIDDSLGRNRGSILLLRSPPNIDIHRISGSQTVVARGRNVHFRLESEFIVVEDVATKHFLGFVLFVFGQMTQRIFRHQKLQFVAHVAKFLILHFFQLIRRKPLSLFLLNVALREVFVFRCLLHLFSLAQPFHGLSAYARNVVGAHHFFLLLRLIVATNLANTFHRDATLHKLRNNLSHSTSVRLRFHIEIHDLLIRHCALCMHYGHTKQQSKQKE